MCAEGVSFERGIVNSFQPVRSTFVFVNVRHLRVLPAGPRELLCCRVLYLTHQVQLLNNQGGAGPPTHTCTQGLELELTL